MTVTDAGDHSKIKEMWTLVTGAVADTLESKKIAHTPQNELLVTLVLLMMAARSAVKLRKSGVWFTRMAGQIFAIGGKIADPARAVADRLTHDAGSP